MNGGRAMKQRFRAKEARQMAEKIMAAEPTATIELTERGHLKVTGPGGTAIIPSKPGDNSRNTSLSKRKLARYAGIHLAA
jgi:hypothetical protein